MYPFEQTNDPWTMYHTQDQKFEIEQDQYKCYSRAVA